MACPSETTIDTQAECLTAIRSLGISVSEPLSHSWSSTYPPGCLLLVGYPHFNSRFSTPQSTYSAAGARLLLGLDRGVECAAARAGAGDVLHAVCARPRGGRRRRCHRDGSRDALPLLHPLARQSLSRPSQQRRLLGQHGYQRSHSHARDQRRISTLEQVSGVGARGDETRLRAPCCPRRACHRPWFVIALADGPLPRRPMGHKELAECF